MMAPDPQMIRQAAIQISRENFFPFVWRVFDTLHPHRMNGSSRHGMSARCAMSWTK